MMAKSPRDPKTGMALPQFQAMPQDCPGRTGEPCDKLGDLAYQGKRYCAKHHPLGAQIHTCRFPSDDAGQMPYTPQAQTLLWPSDDAGQMPPIQELPVRPGPCQFLATDELTQRPRCAFLMPGWLDYRVSATDRLDPDCDYCMLRLLYAAPPVGQLRGGPGRVCANCKDSMAPEEGLFMCGKAFCGSPCRDQWAADNLPDLIYYYTAIQAQLQVLAGALPGNCQMLWTPDDGFVTTVLHYLANQVRGRSGTSKEELDALFDLMIAISESQASIPLDQQVPNPLFDAWRSCKNKQPNVEIRESAPGEEIVRQGFKWIADETMPTHEVRCHPDTLEHFVTHGVRQHLSPAAGACQVQWCGQPAGHPMPHVDRGSGSTWHEDELFMRKADGTGAPCGDCGKAECQNCGGRK